MAEQTLKGLKNLRIQRDMTFVKAANKQSYDSEACISLYIKPSSTQRLLPNF